ncbi:MAG TPA: response regulator [Chitinophagales bacterium]|nr:response regulator [Chitinophagales bacterium]
MNFIIIDDDETNNILCRIIIKQAIGEADVETFVYAREGLDYIESHFAGTTPGDKTVLFLDINMSEMDGWEFLKQYDTLAEDIKSQLRLFILSSSANENDKRKGKENKYMSNYIVKPLRKEVIHSILAAL